MARESTVAVVGGGMAGLAAACRLALAGRRVRLYEASGKLGGCCGSSRVGNYTFNDGALFIGLPNLLEELFRRLSLDRASSLPLRRVSALQRATLPDDTVVTFDCENLVRVEGDDAATARAQHELQALLEQWDPLLQLFSTDVLLRPPSFARLIAKAWRYLPLMRGSVAPLLARSFSNEAVRAAMGAVLLYSGTTPDKTPAPSLLALAAMFRQGYFIPQGGMSRIPEVLAIALRERGGEIHLNSAVAKVIVKDGCACGVEVEGHDPVAADAVISTTSAMTTFGSLLSPSDVPARIARKAGRAVLSHKAFAVQLGLRNRIGASSYSNYVLPFLDEQRKLFEPHPAELPWPSYMVPTLVAPELAPDAGSIVEMFPPIDQRIAPGDWTEERKREVAEQAIERLRGLHHIDIAERRVVSPKEFHADLHLHAAAIYGISPAAGPMALFRHRTPIRGLYLAGQTTWPGFGVASSGLSGVMAAEDILSR